VLRRVTLVVLALAVLLGFATACSRSVRRPAPQPQARLATRPLRLVKSVPASTASGTPVARLAVALSRTATESVSVEATLTNLSRTTFASTSSNRLFITSGGQSLYGGGASAFGGPRLDPGRSWSWSVLVPPAPAADLTITVGNVFTDALHGRELRGLSISVAVRDVPNQP
jgi:hypothetical protein